MTKLFAGSLGNGNDLVEALITAQIIPARIEAEIAVRRYRFGDSWDCRNFFELLERGVPCTRALHFPYREAASSARGMDPPSSKATAWLERNRLLWGKGINDFFEARIATQRIPKRQ